MRRNDQTQTLATARVSKWTLLKKIFSWPMLILLAFIVVMLIGGIIQDWIYFIFFALLVGVYAKLIASSLTAIARTSVQLTEDRIVLMQQTAGSSSFVPLHQVERVEARTPSKLAKKLNYGDLYVLTKDDERDIPPLRGYRAPEAFAKAANDYLKQL